MIAEHIGFTEPAEPFPPKARSVPTFYRFGAFMMDATNRVLFVGPRVVPVSEKLFLILLLLLEGDGDLVTRETFFREIWPNESPPSDANLSQHVFLLRRTLAERGDMREYIRTVPGKGYRLGVRIERKIGLTMKASCERCVTLLTIDGEAYICSYECTFCSRCADVLGHQCANCGGRLVMRPPRCNARHLSALSPQP